MSNVFIIFILLTSQIYSFKPDKKNEATELNNLPKNYDKLNKTCNIMEKCRDCTFDEIKRVSECQTTGSIELVECLYLDKHNNTVDRVFSTEQCGEASQYKIILYLLISFVFAVFGFILRRQRKKAILQNTLEKLSIFKDK